MQKYKKISRFLTFKRFLYQTEEYFYYYFEKTNRNYTNILFFFPTKQKQVSILFLSLPTINNQQSYELLDKTKEL